MIYIISPKLQQGDKKIVIIVDMGTVLVTKESFNMVT